VHLLQGPACPVELPALQIVHGTRKRDAKVPQAKPVDQRLCLDCAKRTCPLAAFRDTGAVRIELERRERFFELTAVVLDSAERNE
jgi:hypothetical protein